MNLLNGRLLLGTPIKMKVLFGGFWGWYGCF